MRLNKISPLFLATGVTMVLASCGGGSSSDRARTTTPPTSTGSAGSGAITAALRDCLKSHGVELPAGVGNGQGGFPGPGAADGGGANGATPPSLPSGFDPEKMQQAFKDCGGSFPNGGSPGGANSQAFQAYTSCLRDHGVKVPTSSSTPGAFPNFDRTSSSFVAANKVCRALLPSPSASPSTTASSN